MKPPLACGACLFVGVSGLFAGVFRLRLRAFFAVSAVVAATLHATPLVFVAKAGCAGYEVPSGWLKARRSGAKWHSAE